MNPRSKRVMAPLKQEVSSHILSLTHRKCEAQLNTRNWNNTHSHDCRVTSGSEHESDENLILLQGIESEEERRDEEFSNDEEEEDNDEEVSQLNSFQFHEFHELPLERHKLNMILKVSSTPYECGLFKDVEKAWLVATQKTSHSHSEEENSIMRIFVMSFLISAGHNAGLCKTRWHKNHSYPSGAHEYIDVVLPMDGEREGKRYLVDLDFRAQFEIARSTPDYQILMRDLPTVFVGSAAKLVKIIKLISNSAKRSLKKSELSCPPWRKYRYMQLKWLAQYKRSTNCNSIDSLFKTQFMPTTCVHETNKTIRLYSVLSRVLTH